MFLRILLSTIGGFLISCLFCALTALTSRIDDNATITIVFFSCLLGIYVGVLWGLWHKGVFNKK